jgi:hypothetical protein
VVRPVPPIVENIKRFKSRYFDENRVVAMELSVEPGSGRWDGPAGAPMPIGQQDEFFQAAKAVASAIATTEPSESSRGRVLYIVTDDEEEVRDRLSSDNDDQVSDVGVVAITQARGDHLTKAMLELTELFLLGYAETVITTPGSPLGTMGAARMNKAPLVVIDAGEVHQATTSLPCLAHIGRIQTTTCFEPSMLSRVAYDPLVPCPLH